MSDVQLLFVVLALLYGWECACWMRRGSVGFVTWLGWTWHAAHPDALSGNQRGGFVFAPPLPPLGTLLTANQFPLSLSPEGALAYVAASVNPGWRPAQTGRFIRFNEIHTLRACGRKIRVNGEILLTAPSAAFARRIAEELQRFAALPQPERGKAIDRRTLDSLDTKAVEQRRDAFQKQSRPVRLLANALFVYLFVFAPILIWQLGLKLTWLGLLAGLLALTVATAAFSHRAHRRLYPAAEDERFTHLLTIALAPTTAIRAVDTLSRPLFEDFHPLAVAKVFLSRNEFQGFARRILLDIRHPALPECPGGDVALRSAELQSRTALQQAVERLLKAGGIEPNDLCRPPAPADNSCHAYCPRCDAQFTTATGTCMDCGGLALVAFREDAGRMSV